MIINRAALQTAFVGFNAAFTQGLGQASSQWQTIATRVNSTTSEEEYGWLGKIPGVREWLGDRVIHSISQYGYKIKNKPFEVTISVPRDDFEDDRLGIYNPLFQEMGRSTGSAYDQIVWPLAKAGFSTLCYDGQYFFDTDHPVLDENGSEISVANTDGGAGDPWFLIDDSRALKPLILQVRRDMGIVRKDDPTDDNVFHKKEFLYGADGRHNVGLGFWQFSWGSKQALDESHYATARAAIMGMKGDYGRPLGLMPKKLIVGPSNEAAALKLIQAENNAAGASNVYRNTATVEVVPWLA